MRIRSRLFGLIALLLLSACSTRIVPEPMSQRAPAQRPSASAPAARPVASTPITASPAPLVAGATARSVGVFAAPASASNSIDTVSANRALKAFRLSCPSLIKRADQSGLTRPDDWRPACAAAAGWNADDGVTFFTQNFEMVQIGDGKSLATGYYEPEIAGSRERRPGYDVPIYARPPELREIDLGQFSEGLKGKKIRGKFEGDTFVPFADRTGIETGALAGRGLEIAWAADPVEFFFLQVQGSGRLKQPDGSVMRIGYDSQNGRDYTGIGKLMKDRGLLASGQSSMQGIMGWLRANPAEGQAIMRENRSWVFFKEVRGAGPLGALGLPVTARASVATDPAFVPLGAPVFLSMDRPDASGLWIAQDTGGAIKGSNRFDTFWGAGADARVTAGGMSARGTAFVLLPWGVRERIAQDGANVASPAP
jgi:membrane-bound lytic murein transglycosylase A